MVMENEQADAGWDGQTRLARSNFQARTGANISSTPETNRAPWSSRPINEVLLRRRQERVYLSLYYLTFKDPRQYVYCDLKDAMLTHRAAAGGHGRILT